MKRAMPAISSLPGAVQLLVPLSPMERPISLHGEIGEGGRPADQDEAVQGFDPGDEAEMTRRIIVAEAKRGIGDGREVEAVLKAGNRLTAEAAEPERLDREPIGDAIDPDLDGMRREYGDDHRDDARSR